MLKKSIVLGLMLFFTLMVLAEEEKDPPQKGVNKNIYETEKAQSFSAKVKSFRNSRGEILVYFEGLKKSGPYSLSEHTKNYAKSKARVEKSSNAEGPSISVTVDDQDNILSVELGE